MNRFVMTLLVSTLASAYALPALAVDDTATAGTSAEASTNEHGGKGKEFRAKWKSMTPAERKQWKSEHPDQVAKWKEHRAKRKAMKEGSASATSRESIAK